MSRERVAFLRRLIALLIMWGVVALVAISLIRGWGWII